MAESAVSPSCLLPCPTALRWFGERKGIIHTRPGCSYGCSRNRSLLNPQLSSQPAHLSSRELVADAPGALHAVSVCAGQCLLLGQCVRVSRLWSMGHMGCLRGNAASPKREGAALPTQMGRDGKGLWCHAGIWEGGQKCKSGDFVCVHVCV